MNPSIPSFVFCSQIARPALFDQAVVNSMVTDMEKVELSTISVQPLLGITAAGEHADTDVYSECKSHYRSGYRSLPTSCYCRLIFHIL